jgi:hypothetical protein
MTIILKRKNNFTLCKNKSDIYLYVPIFLFKLPTFGLLKFTKKNSKIIVKKPKK